MYILIWLVGLRPASNGAPTRRSATTLRGASACACSPGVVSCPRHAVRRPPLRVPCDRCCALRGPNQSQQRFKALADVLAAARAKPATIRSTAAGDRSECQSRLCHERASGQRIGAVGPERGQTGHEIEGADGVFDRDPRRSGAQNRRLLLRGYSPSAQAMPRRMGGPRSRRVAHPFPAGSVAAMSQSR